MKKYAWLCLGLIILVNKINALPLHWDVYGVGEALGNKILVSFKEDFKEYALLTEKISKAHGKDAYSKQIALKRHRLEASLLKKIKAMGRFSFVHFSSIFYQDKSLYNTIDLVLDKDASRFPTRPQRQINRNLTKKEGLSELLSVWRAYYDKNADAFLKGKLDPKSKSCPFVHCTWGGFDKREFKEVVPILETGARKFKKDLIEIIEHSDNKLEREDALFILGSTKEYQDLAHFLMNYIEDSDEGVRNNSMRILSAITEAHRLAGLDIQQIIKALNFPYTTDRNKAAYILSNLVLKDKSIHALVMKRGGDNLIRLLKLKQPNNHSIAYRILKTISNKEFAENDYSSWQKWLTAEKKKTRLGS